MVIPILNSDTALVVASINGAMNTQSEACDYRLISDRF